MKKFNEFFNGLLKKVTKKNLPASEVEAGTEVEKEHITPEERETEAGKKLAKTIAKQHVEEDPKYYTKMKKHHKD